MNDDDVHDVDGEDDDDDDVHDVDMFKSRKDMFKSASHYLSDDFTTYIAQ